MPESCLSIYQACRKTADLTQESAAERLELSVETLKAYELGLRVPSNATVYRMTQTYGTPWLALLHLQSTAGVLEVLPEGIKIRPLPTAAIQLINRVLDFAEKHRDRRLLQIAEDGVIDAGERPEFDAIVHDLDGIIKAALQVKFTPGKRE